MLAPSTTWLGSKLGEICLWFSINSGVFRIRELKMPDQLSRNLLHSTASGQEYPQELSECQRKFSELLVEYDFL
jgi:hypothetical protein